VASGSLKCKRKGIKKKRQAAEWNQFEREKKKGTAETWRQKYKNRKFICFHFSVCLPDFRIA
jgi:hypothetical protein